VGGVVTCVTRVLQGVEGTLQSRDISEARREESERSRPRRATYGARGELRPYSELDALWVARLRTLQGGTLAGARLVIVEAGLREPSVTLVVTTAHLLVVRVVGPGGAAIGDVTVESILQLRDISVVEARGDVILIATLAGGESGLKCKSREQAALIAEALGGAVVAAQQQ